MDSTNRPAFAILTLAFLCVALIAGGSSQAPWSAGVVRIAALPVLVGAIWRLSDGCLPTKALAPLVILAGVWFVPLVQLAPLPPALWSALPGRVTVVDGYEAARMTLPWLPISLTPDQTWNAVLGLLPPTAMFLAALSLDVRNRGVLVAAMPVVAALSVGLGMLQILAGDGHSLSLYQIAGRDGASGLFANRNHQAAFLATALPLAAGLAAWPAARAFPRGASRVVLMCAFGLVVVVGMATTRSRAAVVLAVPMTIGAVAVLVRGAGLGGERGRGRWIAPLALAGIVASGAGLVAIFNFAPLADRFGALNAGDLRFDLFPTVASAGLAYSPVGSGMGSFEAVYQTMERPEMMARGYVNHAHNDYLELWLEAGFAGVVLIGAFAVWWLMTVVDITRAAGREFAGFALAGATVVVLLLAHSVVDYPLRTPALATVLALACALMIEPRLRRRAADPPHADDELGGP